MAAPASEISQLRKAGRLEEALETARQAHAQAPADAFVQQAYGWVIYDLVKREVQSLETAGARSNRVADRLTEWLREYARLDRVERPGLLHSRLLTQVVRVARHWPRFLRFARWWDPANLRDEDRAPFATPDGRTIPSLEVRLLRAIGRAASSEGDHDTDLCEWAEIILDRGLLEHPADPWLPYYKSKLLVARGQVGEARKLLLSMLRRQQRAGWLWSALGRTFEGDDADKAILCYYRAIATAGQPSEVVKTRVDLAKLLAAAERYPEAARQVRTALEVRQEAGYRIPEDLNRLAGSDWYREHAARDLPRELDVVEAVDHILFDGDAGGVKTRLGVIDHHNSEKALAHVAFSPDEGAVLPYRGIGGARELPLGAFVEVKLGGESPRALRVSPSTATRIPGFCEAYRGEFDQPAGRPFGFVTTDAGERVFVPPPVVAASEAEPRTRVEVLAILGEDRKRGVPGWKALAIRCVGAE